MDDEEEMRMLRQSKKFQDQKMGWSKSGIDNADENIQQSNDMDEDINEGYYDPPSDVPKYSKAVTDEFPSFNPPQKLRKDSDSPTDKDKDHKKKKHK